MPDQPPQNSSALPQAITVPPAVMSEIKQPFTPTLEQAADGPNSTPVTVKGKVAAAPSKHRPSTPYVSKRREKLRDLGVMRLECEVTEDGNKSLSDLAALAHVSKGELVSTILQSHVRRAGCRW